MCLNCCSLISLNYSYIIQTKTDNSAASCGLRSRASSLWYPLWSFDGFQSEIMDIRTSMGKKCQGKEILSRFEVFQCGLQIGIKAFIHAAFIHPPTDHPSIHPFDCSPMHHPSILQTVLPSNSPSICQTVNPSNSPSVR